MHPDLRKLTVCPSCGNDVSTSEGRDVHFGDRDQSQVVVVLCRKCRKVVPTDGRLVK